MAQIVAGFGVPHTPIFPHFVKRDGPDCEIAKLFGAQKAQLAATRPDLIVMFDTDHLNTFFLDNLPIFAVGMGTTAGEIIGFEGWSMRVRLDEETLKAIANKTSAEYFYAGTAVDLKKVYETLSSRLTVEKKETEISALFAMAAAALGESLLMR